MRIAQIAPPWITIPPAGYGGTERVVAELADGLVDLGHEVTMFASGGSRTRARLVSPLAVPPDPAELGNMWDDMFHAYSAYLHADEFDVVHDHSGLLGAALGSLVTSGPPIVHTMHGRWTARARALYALMHQRVNLVAISNAQRLDNPEVRYATVVHNGLNPTDFPVGTGDRNGLVFLGRSSPEKGPIQAIEIARRAELPLTMMIKCSQPDEVTYWRDRIEPRLTPNVDVIMNAEHETKVAALGCAQALLFPIQWDEPFGLAMIEALACGTPVIGPDRGSVPEIVCHGETGFVVDRNDMMTATVAAVAELDGLSRDACRASFERQFSSQMMVEGYDSVYRHVVVPEPRVPDYPSLSSVPYEGDLVASTLPSGKLNSVGTFVAGPNA